MKKIFKNKSYIAVIMLVLLALLAMPITSNASLQSRPDATESLTNKKPSEFFLLARQMETSSGPLGLNATIEVNSDNKVVETSDPNNIDVHMIKNTEYGTAAMLAASAYGNCPQGYSITNDSTTQNESGIMQMAAGKYEYVAGIYNKSYTNTRYIYTADSKYKNVYTTEYIPGDATKETPKWRGAAKTNFVYSNGNALARSKKGVFCSENQAVGSFNDSDFGSRVCVVGGAGL